MLNRSLCFLAILLGITLPLSLEAPLDAQGRPQEGVPKPLGAAAQPGTQPYHVGASIRSLVVSPQGNEVLIYAANGIHACDLATGKITRSMPIPRRPKKRLSDRRRRGGKGDQIDISPDGSTIALLTYGGLFLIPAELNGKASVIPTNGGWENTRAIGFSRAENALLLFNGRSVGVYRPDEKPTSPFSSGIRKLRTGLEQAAFFAVGGEHYAVAEKGRLVVDKEAKKLLREPGTLNIFNLKGVRQKQFADQWITALATSPKGNYLAMVWTEAGKKGSFVRVWDLKQNREFARFTISDFAKRVVVSSDGDRVFCYDWFARALELWDSRSGKKLHSEKLDGLGPKDGSPALVYSPDGRYLVFALGGESGRVHLRDGNTGLPLRAQKANPRPAPGPAQRK